jgi:hypothetical protein
MTGLLRIRSVVASLFLALLFIAAVSLSAKGQPPAPDTTEWENEALKLRLFYPSDLIKSDTAEVMQDGHLKLFGLSGSPDPKLAEATRCLRPLLLLELPRQSASQTSQRSADGSTPVGVSSAATATILLAELDVECLSSDESASTTLLGDMAEIVNKVPGMKSIAQPATYTIGWQKVHMAAAQGQPLQVQQQPDAVNPQPAGVSQLYTMGLSTNWNSHLLVWYFSSNSIDTLNRITKTTVRFGSNQAAPLYPLTIGNATP